MEYLLERMKNILKFTVVMQRSMNMLKNSELYTLNGQHFKIVVPGMVA